MINLLPSQEKQNLKLVEAQKRVLIIFGYLLVCLFFLILILFLLNYYISLETTALENLVFTKNVALESYQFQDFREATLKVNQSLAMIEAFSQEEVAIGPFLEEVSALFPEGISFTSISFTKNSRLVENPQTKKVTKQIFANVNLGGVAETREVLYSFKKILEVKDQFQAVYFSPDSWTEPYNAHFSVILEHLYAELPVN